ncbi:MAG: pyrimidine 5'-nucleotidase [Alphaproteobacteria bacterium]
MCSAFPPVHLGVTGHRGTQRTAVSGPAQKAAAAGRQGVVRADTVDFWVFDLDNTLHPASNGLQAAISSRMTRFVAELLDLGHLDALMVQKQLFRDHGTTLRGLMDAHGVEPHAFFDFVNGVDYDVVDRDHRLADAIASLPGHVIIFTNAATRHAEQVVERLGIGGHVDGIFAAETADFRAKPDPHAYAMLIDRFAVRPERAVMVEDIARNLAPAASLGMTTVWLKPVGEPEQHWMAPEPEANYVHHETIDLAAWLEDINRH